MCCPLRGAGLPHPGDQMIQGSGLACLDSLGQTAFSVILGCVPPSDSTPSSSLPDGTLCCGGGGLCPGGGGLSRDGEGVEDVPPLFDSLACLLAV